MRGIVLLGVLGSLLVTTMAWSQMSAYPLGQQSMDLPPPPSQNQSQSNSQAPKYAPRASGAYPGMAPGSMTHMPGQPKDLSNRFGVGVTNLGPKMTPQVSVDWQTSRSAAVQFNLGFDSLRNNNEIFISGRFARNMFIEENLQMFLFLGGGVSSGQSNGKSQSGITLEAGPGVRAFFTGLPNMGWHMMFGLFYKTMGSSRMFTTGVTGLHYYF